MLFIKAMKQPKWMNHYFPSLTYHLLQQQKRNERKSRVSQEILSQKEVPVFDINPSKAIVKIVGNKVSTVPTEIESLKMFTIGDFINEILNQTNLYAQQEHITEHHKK